MKIFRLHLAPLPACLRISIRLAALLLGTSVAWADNSAEDLLKNQFDWKLNNKAIATQVVPLPKHRFGVTLTGQVGSDAEKANLEALANQLTSPVVELHSKLTVKAADPVEVTDLWTLTYVSSSVPSSAAAGEPAAPSASAKPAPSTPPAGSGDTAKTGNLVGALQAIYGPGSVTSAGSRRLLLHGSARTVLDIKRFLALVDAPWPQVQMNIWAVQVSGNELVVGKRINEIMQMVRHTHDNMAEVQRRLARYEMQHETTSHRASLKQQFSLAGIDLEQEGPLSLNEALVLLTLNPQRLLVVKDLQEFVKGQDFGKQLPASFQPFQRLQAVLEFDHETDEEGFAEFGKALQCYRASSADPLLPDAPRRLVRTGATVDRILKTVMDAFAADIDELLLQPMLAGIQATEPKKWGQGVALVGRTRIVVTSGLESELVPEVASYVETTRPKPFGQDLLNTAFPSAKSGDSGTLTGAQRILANLPEGQAGLLAAALLSDVEPTFSKVAPGIAVNVRPTVLPDGGAARLTIDARFGVSSTPTDTTPRTDVWNYPPPPGISSHSVKTDAVVSAFDLFDISSFSIESSVPRSPFYIPILGRLPIIGRAFQFPLPNKVTQFESLLLVNTVILPRSLELHRFYGRELPPPVKVSAECLKEAQKESEQTTAGAMGN